ncbi:Lrp/AsnC family transcriptional regulator [Nocardia transvalensis]|uniref:Lrp/AsnC family transcriptional regulator n=1 Tax=Nocardia transvalensis TaxID=37333 RepID=UPI001893A8A8|nr:AsnC family transcriptional regulator [Nocardia transvalensis]MBF6332300.1 Lrp/AsnC family transcriptional regulator [Nocardia transvalensis]
MQDSAKPLTEGELELVHALQLRPRAPWTELGRALGVDAVTVARRWHRLTDSGRAWVTISPGPRAYQLLCFAFVEIGCATGHAGEVAETLAGHPHFLTIERTTDAHLLLGTVATDDLAMMSRYTLDVLPVVPHVTAVRARVVTHMFTEGGRWRIDALDPNQQTRLACTPTAADRPGSHPLTPLDRALLTHLSHDGRAPHQQLATSLGVSAQTIKRRIDTFTRTGLLRFRCDFARPLGGWPVAVTFWATAPAADLLDIGHALAHYRQTRNCAALSAEYNLVLQVNTINLADVLDFETRFTRTHPGLRIGERLLTMRHHKLLGHILDPHGRSTAVVPPAPWNEPTLRPNER